jgi:hypothetical protein
MIKEAISLQKFIGVNLKDQFAMTKKMDLLRINKHAQPYHQVLRHGSSASLGF